MGFYLTILPVLPIGTLVCFGGGMGLFDHGEREGCGCVREGGLWLCDDTMACGPVHSNNNLQPTSGYFCPQYCILNTQARHRLFWRKFHTKSRANVPTV